MKEGSFRSYFWIIFKANHLWMAELPPMRLRQINYLFNMLLLIKWNRYQSNQIQKIVAASLFFFTKKSFLNPDSTMDLVKVHLMDSVRRSMLILNVRHLFLQLQKVLQLGVWKIIIWLSSDRKFEHSFFKYVHQGDAVVEYNK